MRILRRTVIIVFFVLALAFLLMPMVMFGGEHIGPRIANWQVRKEANGCQFASFQITGGEPGWYYLTCNSLCGEFPGRGIPADYWPPINRLTNFGTLTIYTNVPLLTNFSGMQFRLEQVNSPPCPEVNVIPPILPPKTTTDSTL